MGAPWWIVAAIVAVLVTFLLGYLLAVWGIRHGIRTHSELSRRLYAERQAERDVAQREEAERAAAGRDGGAPREGEADGRGGA